MQLVRAGILVHYVRVAARLVVAFAGRGLGFVDSGLDRQPSSSFHESWPETLRSRVYWTVKSKIS